MKAFRRIHPLVWFVACVVTLPLIVGAVGSTLGVATEILVTMLLGLSFNLLLGYTGRLSFGHAAYYGIGAYTAALLQIKLWPSTLGPVLVAPLVSAAAAAVVAALIVRARGIYFSLLTLAFAQLAYFIVFEARGLTGGEFGVGGIQRVAPFGIPIDPDLAYYAFVAVVVVLATIVLWRIVDSPFGRVLKAIRNNDRRAACLGYNTRLYVFLSFVISGAFAGLAGALSAFIFRYISPDLLHWSMSGTVVMLTLIGGVHTFFGPAVGAFVFVLAKDVLSSWTEHWMIPFGVIFVLFVLLAPNGIGGFVQRLARRDRDEPARRASGRATARATDPTPATAAGDPTRSRTTPRSRTGEVVLAATGLVKRFGDMAAVNEVTVDARRGEIHSIIGPNGAGKTTLFNVLTGTTPSDEGRVMLGGQDVTGESSWQRARRGLARSFQITSVFKELTALENVRIAVQAQTASRFDLLSRADLLLPLQHEATALLGKVGLAGRESEPAALLSHGEQRQLEIAIALGTRPNVLLLDEPLAGLPDAERVRIVELIKQLARDYPVLLIEHDIDRVLEISDRLTVIQEGRVIAAGTPAEIQANATVQEAYLGRAAGKARTAPARARTAAAAVPLLRVDRINTFYDASHILHDVSLEVRGDEIACLLGRNGVGKTTTLRSIIGATPPRSGRVTIDGTEVQGWPAHRVARTGITIVPEGARVFPNLTVMEHMQMAVHHGRKGPWSMQRVLELLPKLDRLRDRRGDQLSGGERKMVGIARGLLANPRLLLLDEPLEGLAPAVAEDLLTVLNAMRGEMAILIVEQKASLVLPLCESAFILNNGAIVYSGQARELLDQEARLHHLLGI